MNSKFKKSIMLFIILAIFLAPISPLFQGKNNEASFGVGVNKAEAGNPTIKISESGINVTENSITINVTLTGNFTNYKYIEANAFNKTFDPKSNKSDLPNDLEMESFTQTDITTQSQYTITIEDLKSHTPYFLEVILSSSSQSGFAKFNKITSLLSGAWIFLPNDPNKYSELPYDTRPGVITKSSSSSDDGSTGYTGSSGTLAGEIDFQCHIYSFTVSGCFAGLLYIFFEIGAQLASWMGQLLDFFVYYSTNSSSYTNPFIDNAFNAIRDIANIFFIIALLYVAIKTILDLNTSNNKKVIGTIIIVALLINFSLFFTEVIIDGTNILAKVFYNQITNIDKNGKINKTGGGGERSISVGLVKNIDPQAILMAGIPDSNDANTYYKNNTGQFIMIALMATLIAFYAAFVFFMVALLFVGRVVALWLAMIFAPIAFASYTLPGVNIPGMGHKEWWDELLKNAFMAPVFIFFLYIIVMFTGFLKTIVTYNASTTDTMEKIMAIIIPFVILMILLMQAKKIAEKLSGEIGKGITGMVKAVGGFVGGAALGAAAFAGTGVVGGLSSKLAGNEGLQKAALEGKGLTGWAAKLAMKGANKGSKATFDLRKTAIGGKLGKGMGMDFESAKMVGLGSKEKGFQGIAERKAKKIEEEGTSYKTKLTDAQVAAGNYVDKHGNKITTSAGLNIDKQERFRDKIGKDDFLSALGYSVASRANGKAETEKANSVYEAGHDYKKEKEEFLAKKDEEYGDTKPTIAQNIADEAEFEKNYKKDKEEFVTKTVEETLDKQAKNIKLAVGGVAVVGLGALTGGGALFGGAGALYGGGLAGATVGGLAAADLALIQQNKTVESERIAQASLKKLTGVENRIKELSSILANQEKVYNDGKTKFSNLYGGDGKIRKDALAVEIAKNSLKQSSFKKEMEKLMDIIKEKEKNNDPTVSGYKTELSKVERDWTKHVGDGRIMKELENIEDNMNKTKQSLFTAKGGNTGTPTKSSSTPSTPHK